MDILRRAAGRRRSGRWWDRGLALCGLAIAVLGFSIGTWALVDHLRGTPDQAEVVSCEVAPALYGRWLGSRTMCEVTSNLGVTSLEARRWHAPGSDWLLRSTGESLFDPELNRDRIWWLPAGALAGAATWWAGLPPRTDLSYGRHAAPRESRPTT